MSKRQQRRAVQRQAPKRPSSVKQSVETLEPRRLMAVTPTLIGDINPTSDQLGPDVAVQAGNVVYFAARPTAADGPELFKTDGTTAGTVLVKDINPVAGSEPENLTNVNGTLYFTADDGTHGPELWKTDGTAAGTTRVAELNAALTGALPADLTNVNGTLYFTAVDTNGKSVWKTDGTAAGTARVVDTAAGTPFSNPRFLTAFGNALVFVAGKGGLTTLFRADGTAASQISTTPNNPRNLTAFNGAIYFTIAGNTADTSAGDLWKTDGTAAGTQLVQAINYLSNGRDIATGGPMVVSGDRLYFTEGTLTTGAYDLYATDGTATGLRKLTTGAMMASYDTPIAYGTRSVLFSYTNANTGRELWTSDGTQAGTKIVVDLTPGAASTDFTGPIAISGNRALFVAGAYGRPQQIYVTDGTAAGTTSSASITTVAGVAYPIGKLNDTVLLAGIRYLGQGDLYRTDGTAAGTQRVGSVFAGRGSSLSDASANGPAETFFSVGSTTYFAADDGVTGMELWRTVNRGAPVRLGDLNPGGADSSPGDFARGAEGDLYFTAADASGGRSIYRLALGSSTPQVVTSPGDADTRLKILAVAGLDRLYFTISGGTFARPRLYRYDPGSGLAATAVTVDGKFISPSRFVRAGNDYYFGGITSDALGTAVSTQQQLFRIAPTAGAVPQRVADIPSGLGSPLTPQPIAAVGSTLYFSASTPEAGSELWKTDGTTTTQVADLSPGTASSDLLLGPFDSTAVNGGVLYFPASVDYGDTQLWRTDGTAAGTYAVTGNVTDPRELVVSNGKVFLLGTSNGQYGVFRVDVSTAAADRAVAVSIGGSGDAAFKPYALRAAGGRVFLTGVGGDDARFELWRADASLANAEKVTVLGPKVGVDVGGTLRSFFVLTRTAMSVAGKDLVFPMYTPERGVEPYRIAVNDTGTIIGVVFDDTNANGVLDNGETAAANVSLYVDLNSNGQFDAGEPQTAQGPFRYQFDNVPAGTYPVRLLLPLSDNRRVTTGSAVATASPADGQISSASFSYGVTRQLPTAVIGGAKPLTVAEGASITLDGRSSGVNAGTIAAWEWDFNFNGVDFDVDATGANPVFDAGKIDGPATRAVALRVVDAAGLASAIVYTNVQITNVAPTATLVAAGAVTAGQASSVAFKNVADVASDLAAGLTYSFDFNNDGDFTDAGDVANSPTGTAAFTFAVAGTYAVRGRVSDKDGGFTDYTTSVTVDPAPTPTDPPVTVQAETGTFSGGTAKGSGNGGYTGTGYADFGGNGSAAQWTVSRTSGGVAKIEFRYANGGTANRPLTLTVNGVVVGTLPFAPTGGWKVWGTVSANITLKAGANTLLLTASTSTGGGNVDSFTITGTGTPPPADNASVSGFVFDDADKDGVFDSGETRPSGQTVFIDADNDGLLDSGEKSVVTGADGSWSFGGLAAGLYRVRRVFATGTTIGTPPLDVNLTAGQIVSGLSIGAKSTSVTPPPTGTASFQGKVFNDNNKNGIYDSGDGVGKGVVVWLDADNDGVQDAGEASVVSDSTGKYVFTNLAAGTYRPRRALAAGTVASPAPFTVTLTNGQTKTGQSLGAKKV